MMDHVIQCPMMHHRSKTTGWKMRTYPAVSSLTPCCKSRRSQLFSFSIAFLSSIYWCLLEFFWTFSIHLLIGRLNPTNCLKNLVYLDIRRLEKAVNAGCSQVLAILVKIGENLIATFIIDTLCDQVNMLGFV